jgi:heparosan-N-sulfate-glucuronate 5-epimerase
LKSFVTRSFQSVFSIGPGYEAQPPGLFFDTNEPRGYFIDFRAKTQTPGASNPSELLPADLAQLGLGWWDRGLAGDPSAADHFEIVCTVLERTGIERNGELLWPYLIPIPKHNLLPPWFSALAQAQAASVFVRAYLVTGDEKFATLALKAIAPILPASDSGLLASTPDGPVPEESPSTPASLVLNGWVYALWGLWDVAVCLGDGDSRELFNDSALCLRRSVHKYDIGWWSRYSRFPHRLPDLAKPFYHRLHIHQLELLYRLLGYEELRLAAQRWARYDTPAHRISVVAQKALFQSTI